MRTFSYFEETGRGNSFERFPYLRVLSERLTEDALKEWELWESCLPAEQFQEPLDTDYLAVQFEFTGGMIKNVILNACVMAVHAKKQLCMELLLQAIRAEYEKMEWPVSVGMWGEYGYLIGCC